jgi:hypothetical protein
MTTQKRLEKISTAISLVGLAVGFSVLGLLIVAKGHDGGALIASGILGILLGAAFVVAACLHWKWFGQIQGGIQVEELPGSEIASEMRQAGDAISFLKNLKDVRVPVGIMKRGLSTRCRPSQKTMQNATSSDTNPTTISVGAIG